MKIDCYMFLNLLKWALVLQRKDQKQPLQGLILAERMFMLQILEHQAH